MGMTAMDHSVRQPRQIVSTSPAAQGPFSAAVRAGGFIYLSGALATGGDGRIEGETIGEQTANVLRTLEATLAAAGSSLDRAVAATVYLRRAEDFAAMNEVYRTFWPADPPTRTTVVAGLAIADALVEIALVAVLSGAERTAVHPAGWPRSPNPYSYAIRSGDTLYLSGLVPRSGRDHAAVTGDMRTQVDAIMANAAEILQAGGLSLDDVVSTRVYLADVAGFHEMNTAYRARFGARPPARATVVAGLTRPEFAVEMTFVAVAGSKRAVDAGGRHNPNLSAAVHAGDRLFLSGTLGATAATSGDTAAQAHEALARLDRTLTAAGFSRGDVVDATVYLTDLSKYGAMNEVYRAFFGAKGFPARVTLGCGLVNPEGLVEIMMTAVR